MIVFDASTLILITKVELLDAFLASIKLEATIPEEVARECCGAKKTLDALMIQKALDESRMRVIVVKNKKLVAKLSADFSLGRGEAEAITLALKEKAQLLGIDDKNGINACKLLGMGSLPPWVFWFGATRKDFWIAALRWRSSHHWQNTDDTGIPLSRTRG